MASFASRRPAMMGDDPGYWVGREFGFPLVYRSGRYVGLDEKRLKLGQFLFLRHRQQDRLFRPIGAVLRALGVSAGVNRREWGDFFLQRAGGVVSA